MKENPLLRLAGLGQSVWMDFIRRGLLTSGDLLRSLREDGVRGVTSNPSIFEGAIDGSRDYEEPIRGLALAGRSAEEIYDVLTVEDIRRTCDLLRPTYDELRGRDGFASLEVSPLLAHDTAATVAEAQRLWAAVDRPNVMIKVPATREGLPAIRDLVSFGINVNITLLFGLSRFQAVADAYLSGLEVRASRGEPLERLASVASFFLSRIDVLVDPRLGKIRQAGGPRADLAARFQGQVAVSSAKLAYRIYRRTLQSDRFRRLADRGARPQRLLWASTSTKNPAESDVKYVEALIGLDTINTLPLETLNAYRDHGDPRPRLEQGLDEAEEVLRRLPELGLEPEALAVELEDEGVEKFVKAFGKALETLGSKRAAALAERVDPFHPEWDI